MSTFVADTSSPLKNEKNDKKKEKKKEKRTIKQYKEFNEKYPLVSICTPTFNRRPFIPNIIKCFQHQTYPKERMEWIIIDDGTDKIEDLIKDIPQIKYFKYDEKMFLGKKRNLMHDKSSGDIIVYMDDDDYYPPERVSHAVETLQKNPQAMCAGSSEMYIYFKHINEMHKFGPYGPSHATAATFAFRRNLLKLSRYDDDAALAEEKSFLKNYTIPFVQMDTMKTILVFSHVHNSFDKKTLLNQGPANPFVKLSTLSVDSFVKEADIREFFMVSIDKLLADYDPGKPEHKPDVTKQIIEIGVKRNEMMKQQQQQQQQQPQQQQHSGMIMVQKPGVNGGPPQNIMIKPQDLINNYERRLAEQYQVLQNLTNENNMMKAKTKYLEEKMSVLIAEKIAEKKTENKINVQPATNN
jgi:glycosyltransferase involved in cell wall biosynthesis